MLLLSIALACTSTSSTPEPAPPVEVEAPAPAPAPPPTPSDPRLAEWFSPAQQADIVAVRGLYDGIETVAGFIAALDRTEALGESLTEPVQLRFEEGEVELELEWLWPILPGMTAGYFAEGTAIVIYAEQATWTAKAAKTPGAADDAFLSFMAKSYDNPTAVGWSEWNIRNWDYGGCSTFGTGTHAAILLEADALAAARSPFMPRVQKIRDQVIVDLLRTETTFPFCDIASMESTPKAALIAEGQRILDGVTLSDEEHAKLKARLDADFAVETIGG
jgi:hypothetical protein